LIIPVWKPSDPRNPFFGNFTSLALRWLVVVVPIACALSLSAPAWAIGVLAAACAAIAVGWSRPAGPSDSERLLELIFETAEVGICLIDEEGKYRRVNPAHARIYGFGKPESVLGKSFTEIFPDEQRPAVMDLHRKFIETGEFGGVPREMVAQRQDGTSVDLHLTMGRLVDREGNRYRVTTVTDISALKQAQAELKAARDAAEAASQAKGAFLAHMSHELRTPLNAIIGMTGLLLETPLSGSQCDFAATVRTAGESLLALVNDILDLSKIESGRFELDEHPFVLRTSVESALDLVAVQAASKGLTLVQHVDPALEEGYIGDAPRIRQVLNNLMSNAVKFTPQGQVVMDVSGMGNAVRFQVRDTGIGIPADRIPALFDPFTQAASSTARKYGGTGLGLSISKLLVELMHGTIEVESTPGKGSTFTVTIPLAPAPPESLPSHERAQEDHASLLQGKRVLLLDANPEHRRALRTHAESWGLVPIEAEGAEEALALLSSGPPIDVVILDVGDTRFDPRAFAAQLPNSRPIKPVMLVPLGHPSVNGDSQYGAFVVKPIKRSTLYQALISALEGRQGPAAAPQPVPVEAPAPKDLLILVAEDVLVNQRLMRAMLERLGYAPDLVGDGRAALKALEEKPYDVILMDVRMPELDGLETTRLIRSDVPAASQPWIVALTAHALAEDRDECLAAGMNDYLSKPVRSDTLREALERAGQHAARRRAAATDAPSA
jgi:PAS domain S-box-containing protein